MLFSFYFSEEIAENEVADYMKSMNEMLEK